jgi:hypothetical protein
MEAKPTIRIIVQHAKTDRRDQRSVCFAPRTSRRPCSPLDDTRSASQTARSSRACILQSRRRGRLPSGAGRRRSGFGASLISFRPLRLPLHAVIPRPKRFLFFASCKARCF